MEMQRITVLDSQRDWIAVYVDDELRWQGHPGDFEWVFFLKGLLEELAPDVRIWEVNVEGTLERGHYEDSLREALPSVSEPYTDQFDRPA